MTAICKQLYACYKGINELQQSQALETAAQRAERAGGAVPTGPGAGRGAGAGGVSGASANAESVMVGVACRVHVAGAARARTAGWERSAAYPATGRAGLCVAVHPWLAAPRAPAQRPPPAAPAPSQPRCLSALGYTNKEIIAAKRIAQVSLIVRSGFALHPWHCLRACG